MNSKAKILKASKHKKCIIAHKRDEKERKESKNEYWLCQSRELLLVASVSVATAQFECISDLNFSISIEVT